MRFQPLAERLLLMAMGSLGTLMAFRLSYISNVDLATKWVIAIMAVLHMAAVNVDPA